MRKRVREQNGLTEDKVEYQDIIWEEDRVFVRERTLFMPRRTVTLFASAYSDLVVTWVGPFPTYDRALEALRLPARSR
jgi:hypothetical protein